MYPYIEILCIHVQFMLKALSGKSKAETGATLLNKAFYKSRFVSYILLFHIQPSSDLVKFPEGYSLLKQLIKFLFSQPCIGT